MRSVAAFLTLLCCLSCCRAEGDEAPLDSGRLDEVGGSNLEQTTGFIVDRTMTNFGAEFVREFAEAWRGGGIAAADLTIMEKPSARWGSTLFV